jgi:hypothetical protein
LDFVQSDAKDYTDIGLTTFGQKYIQKILAEVSGMQYWLL